MKNRLRDEIISAWNYPRERWQRRTVRNLLESLAETRQSIGDGFALLNARMAEILGRLEGLEKQHAALVDGVGTGSIVGLDRSDFPPAFLYEREQVLQFSLDSSIERDYALYESVQYIVAAGISGASSSAAYGREPVQRLLPAPSEQSAPTGASGYTTRSATSHTPANTTNGAFASSKAEKARMRDRRAWRK